MNGAHLHLILNHIPLVGLGFGFLLLCYALLRGEKDTRNAGLLVIIAAGLIAVPTFLTGDPAEDVVRGIAGISRESIHHHERIAQLALISSLAAALAAAAEWFTSSRKSWMIWVVLLVTLASLIFMGYAANLGGQIRHSELSGLAGQALSLTEVEEEI